MLYTTLNHTVLPVRSKFPMLTVVSCSFLSYHKRAKNAIYDQVNI